MGILDFINSRLGKNTDTKEGVMPSNKKQLFSIIVILLLFLGFALAEQDYEFKTLLELQFDKEIEDVAFDSYEENGQIKFYPKIVVLKEIDPSASKGTLVNYALEVRILNRKGKVIKKFPNLKYYSRVHLTKNGNYFGIERVIYNDPLADYGKQKIVSADFSVYNDKGEKKWRLLEPLNYNSPAISSYDGSAYLILSEEDASGLGLDYFDIKGNRKNLIPQPKDFYSSSFKTLTGTFFSDDGKLAAFAIEKRPQGMYSPIEEITIALYDNIGNLLWEYPIPEKGFGTIATSPKGSYVFVDCFTEKPRPPISKEDLIKGKKKLVPPEMQSANVLVLNQKGNLVIKIPTRISTRAVAFSDDERFLHFCDYKSGEDNFSVVVDLPAKKELFRRKIPTKFVWAGVANDGSVIGIGISENLWKLYLLNNQGEILATQDISDLEKATTVTGIYEKIGTLRILGWSGLRPIFGWIGHKAKKIKIMAFAEAIQTIPELEAKTAPVGEPDTTVKWISDTVEFLIKMWENRFGRQDYKKIKEDLKVEKDPDRRVDLIFELGYSYDTSAIQPLIRLLKEDKWAPVRAEAAKALGALGLDNHGTFGESQKNEFVRRKFGEDRLQVLLAAREEKILPALKDALHDKDIFVIFNVASELVALGDTTPSTLKVLFDIFRKKNMQNWKAQFIPRPDIPPEDQPQWKEMQRQAVLALPGDALNVLKRIRTQLVVDEFTEALKDADPWVRLQAKKALEEIKGEKQKR